MASSHANCAIWRESLLDTESLNWCDFQEVSPVLKEQDLDLKFQGLTPCSTVMGYGWG